MSKQYGQSVPLDKQAFCTNPGVWLTGQMSADRPYVLIYADDGIIWGKRQEDGTLRLSGDIFKDPQRYPSVAVRLRATTLQQAAIFGPEGELRVWRTAEGFAACLLTDANVGLEALPDEGYLLWHLGNPVELRQEEGFALLQEGAQGQHHALPLLPQGRRRPRLVVRHYVDYDKEGQAYIAQSRLFDLQG